MAAVLLPAHRLGTGLTLERSQSRESDGVAATRLAFSPAKSLFLPVAAHRLLSSIPGQRARAAQWAREAPSLPRIYAWVQ
jgi:hypothetical protein